MSANTLPSGRNHLASHLFNVIVLAGGAGAFAWMLHHLGLAAVHAVFREAGGWFAVLLALDGAVVACDAAAIHAFMRPEARMVSYWRVLAAQASGRAVNILTPGGALGEATKVTMLVAHAPQQRVVSSIVLFNLATIYLSVAIVVIGVPITMVLVDLPPEIRIAVWIGLGVIVPLVIALGVVVQRGALATIVSAARGMRLLSSQRAQAWADKLLEIDRHLRELLADRSPGTRTGLALIAASRLLSWAATIGALAALGVELDFTLLAGVLSVGVLITWISSFVPLGLGVAEGGNYALFGVLGASGSHGVSVTLLARARNLAIALVGLLVMATGHTANRISLARRNRRIHRAQR